MLTQLSSRTFFLPQATQSSCNVAPMRYVPGTLGSPDGRASSRLEQTLLYLTTLTLRRSERAFFGSALASLAELWALLCVYLLHMLAMTPTPAIINVSRPPTALMSDRRGGAVSMRGGHPRDPIRECSDRGLIAVLCCGSHRVRMLTQLSSRTFFVPQGNPRVPRAHQTRATMVCTIVPQIRATNDDTLEVVLAHYLCADACGEL